MSLFRPIHHTFAPLADREQRRLALSLLLHPSQRNGTTARDLLRTELSKRLNGSAYLFASGREALLAFLRSCDFAPGDEIIVQAYTCVVVPNAIHAAQLIPVYADIEKDTLNLDLADVEKRISPRTKAVICQHTFGIPSPVEELRALCDRHGLLLIEDCAHVLPDAEGPMEVTSRGDAVLLSFGRDKAVSGITGGAVICRHATMDSRIQALEQQTHDLPAGTVLRLLLYPLLYAIARPLFGLGIGKIFLAAMRSIGLLVPIVTTSEKDGTQGGELHAMPEACAHLVIQQFTKLRRINDHRRVLVRQYLAACAEEGWPVLHGIRSDLPLQKFPLFVPNAAGIRHGLKRKNIHLDDGWTGCVVCPASASAEQAGYAQGADPRAEEACEAILSLPTHPGTTEDDARGLVQTIASLLNTTNNKGARDRSPAAGQ